MNIFPILIPVTRRKSNKCKDKKLIINANMISMLRPLQEQYDNPDLKGCFIRIANAYEIEVEEEMSDICRMIIHEIHNMNTTY